MGWFIILLIVLIPLLIGIKAIVLYVKKRKVKGLFRKYPVSFFLQMYKRNEFTYYDTFFKSRIHNRNYLKNVNEKIIDTKFKREQCDAILSLSEKQYELWERDYNYVSSICEKYNDALFEYIIDNQIWESWGVEPDDVGEHYLESLSMDLLHKLAEVNEDEYARLQGEYDKYYEIEDKKLDASSIIQYFKQNRIRYLYHFTDIKNLPSIVASGGLYSWVYCENNGIKIKNPAGGSLSRRLDTQNDVADYVHLSFTYDHPMKYKKESEGAQMIVFRIHPAVAIFKDTLFSTKNATDKNAQIGSDYNTLCCINYEATQMAFLKHEDSDFKYSQAEVLVKTHIPLKYIVNLRINDDGDYTVVNC